jgi:uncharacterized delta-60 repeat protein
MARSVKAVTQIVLISVLALAAIAQKGKPSACPSPPPLPTVDTKCFLLASGCLDQTFGSTGRVDFLRPAPYTGIRIDKVVAQQDGKILAVGSFTGSSGSTINTGLIIRFNGDGSLDTSFGDIDTSNPLLRRGYVADGAVANQAVAIAEDGSIVVGGAGANFGRWQIRRYTSTGEKDPSFGQAGVVAPGFGLTVTGLAVLSDGKILAVGNDPFLLMKLDPNGTPDPTFGGGDGVVSVSPSTTAFGGGAAYGMAIQSFPDGSGGFEQRIILSGYGFDGATRKNQDSSVNRFALIRLKSDGSLDTTFDGDGRVLTDFFGRQAIAFSIAVDPSNKIVAAGQVHPSGCTDAPDMGFARYNENGSLDASFSVDGKANIDVYGYQNYGRHVAIQMIGSETKIVGFGATEDGRRDLVVLRLNNDGSLDQSFGPGTFGFGKVTYDTGPAAYSGYGAIQPDDKIVIAGSFNGDLTLIRYLP